MFTSQREFLRPDDGDGNGSIKKAIGLLGKTTTNFARAYSSRFFVRFFTVTARLPRENA